MKWALVVHDEPQLAECLGGILADKLGPSAERVVTVQNLAEAREAIVSHGLLGCQVMVVSFSAPPDAEQAPSLEGNRPGALAFFSELHDKRPGLPFVFLARVVDASSQALCAGLHNTSLLGINGIHRTLPTAVGDLVLGERLGSKKARHEVDVDITLRLGGACTWGMRGAGGSALEDAKPFAISEYALERLIEDSNAATRTKDLGLIQRVGKDMYNVLFAHNVDSGLELALRQNILLRERSYLEAARFRFHLDSRTNQLLVETLAKPSSSQNRNELDYWMLRSPIYRKYDGHGERKPLFKDRRTQTEPIDCLIIQGHADDFSAGPPVNRDFAAIALAESEVRWLQTYWTEQEERQRKLRLGSVRIVRPATSNGRSFGKEVRAALRERQWHLIHYAGHSIATDRRGYLVLGDGPDDMLDIDTFAADARGAQFVFLNSCSSANATFVARLVEENIPAVAGYAWPLEDKHALAFSRKFYEELFEGERSQRFLEYAFMRAKAHLFEKFHDQPAWAAPLLFMQTSHADHD